MIYQRPYNREDLEWNSLLCDEVSVLCDVEQANAESKPVVMDFVASTERLSRTGHIIDFDGMQVKNFKAYGPILFDHNYSVPPVGRSRRVQKIAETRQTNIRAEFDTNDELAMTLAKKYQTGFMKAVSVGVMVFKREGLTEDDLKEAKQDIEFGSRLTSTDLLELSLVSVGANPDAMKITEQAIKNNIITEKEAQQWMDDLSQSQGASNRANAGKGNDHDVSMVIKMDSALAGVLQKIIGQQELIHEALDELRGESTTVKALVAKLSQHGIRLPEQSDSMSGSHTPGGDRYAETLLSGIRERQGDSDGLATLAQNIRKELEDL